MDKILGNIHWLIIIYAVYSYYGDYEQFEMQMQGLKGQKEAAEANVNRNKLKLKKIAKYRDDLDKYQKWVVEVTEQIDKLRKRLPSEINDGFMMQSIREKASEMNIISPLVQSGKDILNGFYIKKNYTLNGKGTFLQFLVFLENVDKFEQLLNVNTLELKAPDRDKQRGRFFIVDGMVELEAYRYNPSYVDTSVPKAKIENDSSGGGQK